MSPILCAKYHSLFIYILAAANITTANLCAGWIHTLKSKIYNRMQFAMQNATRFTVFSIWINKVVPCIFFVSVVHLIVLLRLTTYCHCQQRLFQVIRTKNECVFFLPTTAWGCITKWHNHFALSSPLLSVSIQVHFHFSSSLFLCAFAFFSSRFRVDNSFLIQCAHFLHTYILFIHFFKLISVIQYNAKVITSVRFTSVSIDEMHNSHSRFFFFSSLSNAYFCSASFRKNPKCVKQCAVRILSF